MSWTLAPEKTPALPTVSEKQPTRDSLRGTLHEHRTQSGQPGDPTSPCFCRVWDVSGGAWGALPSGAMERYGQDLAIRVCELYCQGGNTAKTRGSQVCPLQGVQGGGGGEYEVFCYGGRWRRWTKTTAERRNALISTRSSYPRRGIRSKPIESCPAHQMESQGPVPGTALTIREPSHWWREKGFQS